MRIHDSLPLIALSILALAAVGVVADNFDVKVDVNAMRRRASSGDSLSGKAVGAPGPTRTACTPRNDLQMNNLSMSPELNLNTIYALLCKKGGCGNPAPPLRYLDCDEVKRKHPKPKDNPNFDPQCLINGSPALAVGARTEPWAKDESQQVIIATPLIWIMLNTPEQVAFVLGHEVTHVVENHHKERLDETAKLYPYYLEKRKNEGVNTQSWPLMFHDEAFLRASPDEFMKFFKEYVPAYLNGKFRDQERRADRQGLGTIVAALGFTRDTAYSGKCAMEAMAATTGFDPARDLPLSLFALQGIDKTHDSLVQRAADLGRQGDSIMESSRAP